MLGPTDVTSDFLNEIIRDYQNPLFATLGSKILYYLLH